MKSVAETKKNNAVHAVHTNEKRGFHFKILSLLPTCAANTCNLILRLGIVI